MNWLGEYPEDHATVVCMFTTHDDTGAPVAPNSAFEAADVLIYKNGSNAQKTTTNGVTMTSPFDTTTGLHCVVIDTSNDTGDGGFWVTGAVYTLVLAADETVDGVAVTKVIGQFGIELHGALRPTTLGRRLDVSAGGEAGIDWANIGSPTTAVNLSGTNIDTDQVVASVTGAVGSVTGAVGSVSGLTNATIADAVWDEAQADHVAAGSFGVIASEIADILVDTAEIGAAGAGLTNINLPDQTMNITGNITGNLSGSVGSVTGAVGSVTGNVGGNVTGSVGSVAAGGIAAASFAAGAIDAAAIAANAIGASELAADAVAEIADAVWDELQADHVGAGSFGLIASEIADILVDTAEIGAAGAGLTNINLPDQTMNITGNITGNLSGSVGSVTGLTTNTIADQVWLETLADHSGSAGSTAAALNAAGSAGDPWNTALPGAYGAGSAGFIVGTNINAPIGTVDTVVDAIKAKTDSLTFTVAGQVDANIESVNGTTVNGSGTAGDPWGP